ncbi:NAD-dependent epimerase/dehydratase family protein [Patulibacter defluvii]|uniref:NAD-dependent epimerase/dehydratase family protein n=1 Tax=Patulibacter defluvii TaxID=3095358 RepID=UPI002A75E76A|nr:NAD-dependent epimerase/dehydratase family protein [Patulibacter sp. DM4]
MTDDASGLRILVTAAASRLGALIVGELERRPEVATVIAVDERPPAAPFGTAEFVRLGDGYAQLPRVVRAASVDVLVDVRAAAAVARLDDRALTGHEPISERIAAACTEAGSPLRRLVTVGSVHRYGWHRELPAFVSEETVPPETPRGPLQRALAAIEQEAQAAADRHGRLELTLVRLADTVGPAGTGLLQAADRLPLLPTVLGFDPPLQVVHEEDAARAVAHVVRHQLTGPYIVAADGTLSLSEALRELGRSSAPLLPPWGVGLLAGVLQRAGLRTALDLAGQLRHGRGLDNRRLKASGFSFRSTTREALRSAAGVRRRRRVLHPGEPAPYDPEVEAFLRYSPSVRDGDAQPADGDGGGIGALEVEALIALLPSLDGEALRALRAHEDAGPGRRRILDEIDLLLQRS